jgi:two-component system, LytTR family, sensor kinase
MRRPWVKWGIIFGCWNLFGLFFASQSIFYQANAGREIAWRQNLLIWLTCSYVWCSLTPLILGLARRFPIEKKNWPRALLLNILASIFFSTFSLLIYVFVYKYMIADGAKPYSVLESYRNLIVAELHAGILIYWAIFGINHTIDYYLKYRDRELRASQLETQLAQARLDSLKMQLHPHFLFNTLNTISILMLEDPKAANNMLVRLSDLLRIALENDAANEVSLKQEIDFLENYLEIERMRFQDRLTIRMKIDPAALDARVPNLILQPLVENAIRHGIAGRAAAGLIEISAERVNGRVLLQVRDDGPGLREESGKDSRKKIGLSNTRARLEQLYGEDQSFELESGNGRGTIVTVTIPFHTDSECSSKTEGNR